MTPNGPGDRNEQRGKRVTTPPLPPDPNAPGAPTVAADPLKPKIILEFLGAAAGISAFVTLVGGALMWVRIEGVGLPAERVISLLPRSLLITVGAHALIVPAVAGLAAVIILYSVRGWSDKLLAGVTFVGVTAMTLVVWDVAIDKLEVGWGLLLPGIVAAIVGGVAAWVVNEYCEQILLKTDPEDPDDEKAAKHRATILTLIVIGVPALLIVGNVVDLPVLPHGLAVLGVGALGATSIIATARTRAGYRPVSWVVFVSFLLVGAALEIARTANKAKLEPVAVLLKQPADEMAGFYIGESDGRIHIAELKRSSGVGTSGDPVEAVVSVSRDRVMRMALRAPAGLGIRDGGRGEAEALLEELRLQHAAAPEAVTAPVATTKPTETFAPLLSLHSSERAWPTDVGYFLRNSTLEWAFPSRCRPRDVTHDVDLTDERQWGQIKTAKRKSECGLGKDEFSGVQYTRPFGKGRHSALTGRQGFNLDLADRRRYPPKLEEAREGTQRLVKEVPVYYERHPEREAPKSDIRITYWFFYPFSVPPGGNDRVAHEGDWERMSVLVRKVDEGMWRPLSVRYHEHDTHVDIPWAEAPKAPGAEGQPTHPRGYVALGSHATYRNIGRHQQVLAAGPVEIVRVFDDARRCPECPLWFTWQKLVDATAQPWYDFGGSWGEVGQITGTTGPLGPSVQKTLDGKAPDPSASLDPSVVPQPQQPQQPQQPGG